MLTTEIRTYRDLFFYATGCEPYPYQECLATTGTHIPPVMSIPTGAGKTAAITLAWLWRRRFIDDMGVRASTPRRLIYSLPMRVLTEQTWKVIVTWLYKVGVLKGEARFDHEGHLSSYDPFGPSDTCKDGVSVHMLMGGDVDRDWDRYPEQDCILVGTQDQLLSRALNRGYAMSRFRWPMQFGLLNADALWVYDEIQLMGNGLATSLQYQGFRSMLGVAAPVQSVWMSATINNTWLDTVDAPVLPNPFTLSEEDTSSSVLSSRLNASKSLNSEQMDKTGKAEAGLIIQRHKPDTMTLVVLNTVKRAKIVFGELQKALKKVKEAPENPATVLLHSHFRPGERASQLDKLKGDIPPQGLIAVCTQVVEAGVDISAATLITDLAPWASLIQRFGRCNRYGEYDNADIFWLENPASKDAETAPYTVKELIEARDIIQSIGNARPVDLPSVQGDAGYKTVIRKRDLIELFDTTPDLAGADIDVSRFIRESDDHNVSVFWRDIDPNVSPEQDAPQPNNHELCPAPTADLKIWCKKKPCWRWDHLENKWEKASKDTIYPGVILMLRSCDGGYDATGWNLKSKKAVPVIEEQGQASDSNDADRFSETHWESIAVHTDKVFKSLEKLLSGLPPLDETLRNSLLLAARWHDVGKGHEVFQNAMTNGEVPKSDEALWAKTVHKNVRYERPGFRHELASGLLMLQHDLPDLAAYLAATHHGKVRLSIRSLPHENVPDEPEKRFARGIWDGDKIPAVDLGASVTSKPTTLDLSFMELGDGPQGPSWLARMLALRDDPGLGPFVLAYLEALLRIADWRASDGGEV